MVNLVSSVISWLAVYFLLWWLAFYIVLPFSNAEKPMEQMNDKVTDGGGYRKKNYSRKFFYASLLSLVFWALIFFVVHMNWVNFDTLMRISRSANFG